MTPIEIFWILYQGSVMWFSIVFVCWIIRKVDESHYESTVMSTLGGDLFNEPVLVGVAIIAISVCIAFVPLLISMFLMSFTPEPYDIAFYAIGSNYFYGFMCIALFYTWHICRYNAQFDSIDDTVTPGMIIKTFFLYVYHLVRYPLIPIMYVMFLVRGATDTFIEACDNARASRWSLFDGVSIFLNSIDKVRWTFIALLSVGYVTGWMVLYTVALLLFAGYCIMWLQAVVQGNLESGRWRIQPEFDGYTEA